MMVHVTVKKSHDHISQWNMVEGSRSNDVITAYLTYVPLK